MAGKPEESVREEDAREMVRLVSEVAALQVDHVTAKRFLMNGLTEIINADCWVWGLGYLDPNKPPIYAVYLNEGFDEHRFARYLQASEHPGMKVLMGPFTRELMAEGSQLTRTRQQVDPGRAADQDASVAAAYECWLAADIGPIILSARPLNQECVSIIGLYRRADQPLFDERERKLAHIILSETCWLHAEGWPEEFAGKTKLLSRQRRLVLNLMLEGHCRKRIAGQLKLSVHTVSDYVKDIYRNFSVQSQAELMHRFTVGSSQGF